MTDKKLSMEFVLDYPKVEKGELLTTMDLQNAFLAGLKAGRPKWHDLRKDPTDVPKENVTVLLLTEVEPVTARYDNEYEAFFRFNDKLNYCVFIAPMSYIAWCEIPKFEESESC